MDFRCWREVYGIQRARDVTIYSKYGIPNPSKWILVSKSGQFASPLNPPPGIHAISSYNLLSVYNGFKTAGFACFLFVCFCCCCCFFLLFFFFRLNKLPHTIIGRVKRTVLRFRCSWEKMAKVFANSGDPDQTPRFAASDLGLHCLTFTLLGVSRERWVNTPVKTTGFAYFRRNCTTFLKKKKSTRKRFLYKRDLGLHKNGSFVVWSGSLITTYRNVWITTSLNVPSDMCAQRRFRSACAFAQSGQNLHWTHFG